MSTILHCQRRQRLTLVLTFALILQNHGNQDFLDVGMLIVVFRCMLPSIFYHCLKIHDEEADCIWKFLVYFHNQGLKKCWCGQKPSAVAKPGQKWKWRSTLKMFDRPNWLLHCSMCVRSSSLIIPAGPQVDPPLVGCGHNLAQCPDWANSTSQRADLWLSTTVFNYTRLHFHCLSKIAVEVLTWLLPFTPILERGKTTGDWGTSWVLVKMIS